MKGASFLFVFLFLIILVSCSPYRKVSLSNFREYKVSPAEMKNLSYVLKKQRLHYSDTDRRYIINNYNLTETEAYESHNIRIDDNIVIPVGAQGVCIHQDSKHFVVDFGKGVQVPFIVQEENNRPKDKFVIGKRVYGLDPVHQKARLYFKPAYLKSKKSAPGT